MIGVSFGSVLLDLIVVSGLPFLVVVVVVFIAVVVVWVTELEYEQKCYESIVFSHAKYK